MSNRFMLLALLALAVVGCSRQLPPRPVVGAVAFIDLSDGGAVRLVQAASGNTSRSLSAKLEAASTPAWSPDGTHIAFSACSGGPQKCFIYLMRADGSDRHKVAEGSSPRWSPLGDRVAFLALRGTYHDVYVVDANGQNERMLTSTPDDKTFGVAGTPAPSAAYASPWSPDERQFALTRNVSASGTTTAHGEVHLMRSDGTDDVRIASAASNAAFLTWSADGKQLLVYATMSATTPSLYVVDRTSGAVRPLLPDGVNGIRPMAVWAPDGQHIAFAAGDSVYEVAADGTQLTVLTRGQCDGSFGMSWAPDSQQLAFVRGCTAAAAEIWQVMPGTRERILSAAGGLAPEWSPAR